MYLEIEYDKNCLLVGDVAEVDASFGHAFGYQKQTDYKVKNFSVVVYIQGFDYDLTKSLKESELEHFKEIFLESVIKKYFSEGPDAA